jgi:phosphatidate cytidylyltransferase
VADSRDERDKGERGPEDQDLFEDLDEFFAPLEGTDWPEGEQEEEPAEEGPAPTPPPPAAEGPLEDFEVAIDVPDESELLGQAEEPSLEEPVEEPPSAESDEEPLSVEDLREAPAEYSDLPGPGGPGEGEGVQVEEEEQPVLAEEASITSADELFEEEVPPEEAVVVEPGLPGEATTPEGAAAGEEEPAPEAVEAAAEHFAAGMRETPEEVERELLADLSEEPAPETVAMEPAAPPPTTEAEGPTWEEGAHPVITEEPVEEPSPAGPLARNLPAAFASGILLAVAVIALLLIGKGAFVVLVTAVVLLGQAELYAVMRTRKLQPATLLGLVCGGLMIAGAYLRGAGAVPFGLFLSMALTVLWYMAAPVLVRRSTTINVGATILGTVYVPFLASFAVLLLTIPGQQGINVFLVVVGLTVLYDVCAYAIGTLWGSRPLAPTISPQKSWEGALGATFVLLLAALSIVPSIDPFTASRAVGLALVIAVAAPLGDLVESALKRDLGVKDMGSILPGHGGILDRIDAILLAAPAAYYYLLLS